MSLLVVGLSHRTAPVRLLEQTALTEELVVKLLGDVVGSEHVSEAVAVATCNRLEVYAEVSKFHGALAEVSELLAQYTACRATCSPGTSTCTTTTAPPGTCSTWPAAWTRW
jgi:glutamyl-tRNA reductase